jgi:argininosuccinate lyase
MTFRKAHKVVGDIILSAQKKGRELHEMNLTEMKKFSALIEDDVYKALDPVSCINNRNIAGGTGTEVVREALSKARKDLKL